MVFMILTTALLVAFVERLDSENWRSQVLPLGRIKKIMKSEEFAMQEIEKISRIRAGEAIDPDRKAPIKFMISAEAPTLMTKACELLIRDIVTRAWKHTDSNRRKTLQRADIHAAVGESEVFDFLIDIVPRVSATNTTTSIPTQSTVNRMLNNTNNMANAAVPQADPAADGDLGQFNYENLQLANDNGQQQQQPSIPQLQQQQWAADASGGV
jgi:histone H3/H4